MVGPAASAVRLRGAPAVPVLTGVVPSTTFEYPLVPTALTAATR